MSTHEPFFTIITPTHRRADMLLRAIDSVLKQSYPHFSMIIVNDSPEDLSYSQIESVIVNDPRIVYIKNEKSSGANFSRNRGLDMANDNSWIILLDDDDYLHPQALETAKELIIKYGKESWFMLNRATNNGISLTHIDKEGKHENYAIGFLITKRYKGDATHIIRKSVIKNIYFPKTIRQGDEWLFFYELSIKTGFFYKNWNATLTDGYDSSGLNYRHRGIHEQLHTVYLIVQEGLNRGLLMRPVFLVYTALRVVRAFIKG